MSDRGIDHDPDWGSSGMAFWDQSWDMLAIADQGGHLTDVSPSWTRVLGWTDEQLTSRPYLDFVHPDDLERTREAAHACVEPGAVTTRFENRYRGVDGDYHSLEWSVRVDEVGGRMYCVVRDMTELRRAERSSADSEHRFTAMFEEHSALMLLIDPGTGEIVDANPSAAAFYGYSQVELRAMNISQINTLPAEEVARHRAEALVKERSHFVFPHRLASGEVRLVSVNSSLIHDGRPLLMSIIFDVEDRFRVETALAESESRYRMLSEHAEGAVMLVSPTGDVIWVSPSIERILGYTPAEAMALRGGDLLHPDDLAATRVAVERLDSDPTSLQARFLHKDGRYRWMAATSRWVTGSDGRRVSRIDALRDIDDAVMAQQRLTEQSQRLELVLSVSQLGMWDWNMQTGETIFDERWAEIVGYRLEELQPTSIDTWTRLAHPDDLEGSDQLIAAHSAGLAPFYDLDARMRHRDGRWVWVHDRGRIIEWSADGRPLRMIGTHEDITERMDTAMTLRSNQSVLEQAQRMAHVGSWQMDVSSDHVIWSEELYIMLGLDPMQAPPDFAAQSGIFTPESWARLTSALPRTRDTGVPYELELETVRPDGSHAWMLARGEAVRGPAGDVVGLQGVAMDITQRKHDLEALLEMATHDPLTGLSNRAALLDEISRALSAGRRSNQTTAVLMLDLDRFKDVNDTLGHGAGDELLVAATARIRDVIRTEDLAARPGGDEFVVVMRGLTQPDDALRAAERLLQAFRQPFVASDSEVYATASIGVAIAYEGCDADDLVREADAAMYAAKAEGRDRSSVFNEDLRAAAMSRLFVEAELRYARDRHQFEVWYQPEVDLSTGAVVALEALLRWHHPSGEVYAAERFIDLAEETGLIVEIGGWALRQACAQAARWASAYDGHGPAIRVNLSAVQLADAGLLGTLDDALTTSGLAAAQLSVEITGTAMLRETATVRDNLQGIHERGVAITIDDFGTGYSSLAYLRQNPVDVLKIDRSLVRNVARDPHDRQLVAGIIALATELGLSVTAEGVEHEDQAACLQALDCPAAQGYLFSRALPADGIEALIQSGFPPRSVDSA